jgi:hypothetical protein
MGRVRFGRRVSSTRASWIEGAGRRKSSFFETLRLDFVRAIVSQQLLEIRRLVLVGEIGRETERDDCPASARSASRSKSGTFLEPHENPAEGFFYLRRAIAGIPSAVRAGAVSGDIVRGACRLALTKRWRPGAGPASWTITQPDDEWRGRFGLEQIFR